MGKCDNKNKKYFLPAFGQIQSQACWLLVSKHSSTIGHGRDLGSAQQLHNSNINVYPVLVFFKVNLAHIFTIWNCDFTPVHLAL